MKKKDHHLLHQKLKAEINSYVAIYAKKNVRLDEQQINEIWSYFKSFSSQTLVIEKLDLLFNRLLWQKDEGLNHLFIKHCNKFYQNCSSKSDKQNLRSKMESFMNAKND